MKQWQKFYYNLSECRFSQEYVVWDYVPFKIMSHLGLFYSRLCRIWDYFTQDYVAFGILSLNIMSHLGLCMFLVLCRFWDYVAFCTLCYCSGLFVVCGDVAS